MSQQPSAVAEKPKAKAQEEVTFIWNVPNQNKTIVIRPAVMLHTIDGSLVDPSKPALRLKIEHGKYTTSDPEIIKALDEHQDYGKPGPDGFHRMKKITPADEAKALLERTGMSKEELAKLITQAEG